MEEQLAVPNFVVFSKVVNNAYSHSQEETELQGHKITFLWSQTVRSKPRN